jgi:hypothetical protein
MADFISFSCNNCGMLYRVPFAQAGRSVQCKQCKTNINIPTQSQVAMPSPLETSVDMNAGDVVMRKETSARRAPTGGTSSRTARVPSGRTASVHGVAPVAPLPQLARPANKGAAPIIIVVAVVVVLGALVAMIIYFGTKDPQSRSSVAAENGASNKPKEQPAALSEADKLRREFEDPTLTSERALDLYRRAQAAKFAKVELSDLARRVLNKLYDDNGGKLSGAQVLGLVDEFATYDLQAETMRLVRLVVARESETAPDGKPNEVFRRMQKMLGREKFEFDSLVQRSAALVEADQKGATELHQKLGDLAKSNPGGWVESADTGKARDLVTQLEAMEKSLKDLERDNPTLVADRAVFKKFKTERAAKAQRWMFISSELFIIYVQLTEPEKEDEQNGEAGARDRVEALRAIAARLGENFVNDWVKPLDLKRSLPAKEKPEEREKKRLEIVVCRDNRALAGYASGVGESMQPGESPDCFYTLKAQRVCVSAEKLGSGAEQLNTEVIFSMSLYQMLFNHYSKDPLLRDEDQRDRGIFHSMLLDNALLRCILTPVRANSRIYLMTAATSTQRSFESCQFFDELEGLNALLARWRKPFARGLDGKGIDSFGAAAFGVRDLVEMISDEQGVQAVRKNFGKVPEIDERLAAALTEGNNYRLLRTAYGDALVLFLYHFERGGKPVYREGLMKFIAADLKGMKREDSLKGFEEALGLNEAKWKQLETEFAASQK